MTGVKPDDVWHRLARCGRLPSSPTEQAEVATSIWLADYRTALKHASADAALSNDLQNFLRELAMAEQKSGSFFPQRCSRQIRVKKYGVVDSDSDSDAESETEMDTVLVENCAYQADDGTDIGFVYMSTAGSERQTVAHDPILLLRWGGNGELAAMQTRSPFRGLVAKGRLRALFVDYRGFGWSGGEPSLETLRSDGDAFYRALPQILEARGAPWPPAGPLVLMGRSIGSLCVLHVGLLHAPQISGLILDSPVACHWPFEQVPEQSWRGLLTHLPQLQPACRQIVHCGCCHIGMLAQTAREAAWLDPFDLVQCVECPLLLLCGDEDFLCPQPAIQALFDSSAAESKSLFWLQGLTHNEVTGSPRYWTEISSFFAQVADNFGKSRSTPTCDQDEASAEHSVPESPTVGACDARKRDSDVMPLERSWDFQTILSLLTCKKRRKK